MNNKKILLKVRNVKKYFNTPSGVVKAIDDVSFDVQQGEIIGLIGESGSGKTTVGRCLIRLYEEYSGFVGLDEQAISGTKLNKRKKRFLNQNMQMIFQDPHASLNDQQNIYTILKEPLIVNKIMRNEYSDLFSDWQDVKNNFKYTFIEKLKELELETITHHVEQAKMLLNNWKNKINNINKFTFDNLDDDFNQYYSYKIECQEREGNVISKAFKTNSTILDLYFEYQKRFRNNEIDSLEEQLKRKKEIYSQSLKEAKFTKFDIEKNEQLKKRQNYLFTYTKNKNQTKQIHDNIINSYIKEFKNSYLEHLEQAKSKTNINEYNKIIVHYLLSKKMYLILKSIKKEILFLSSERIDILINDFKQYKNNFLFEMYNNFVSNNPLRYKKYAQQYIEENFKFNFNSYCAKSKEAEGIINERIRELKNEIKQIRSTFPTDKNIPKIKTGEEIEKMKEEYFEVEEKFQQVVREYVIDFNKRMDDYNRQIDYNLETLETIRNELKEVDVKFEQTHKRFIKELKEHLLLKNKSEKYIDSQVSIYNNKVKNKIESLKSFNKESNNLKKDFIKLKHLLGVESSIFSKIYIKKILIREKIFRALEEVGLLRQFAWRYPHEFSGGQRQRIVIARALISNPKIIIADEPIASLDVSIQAQVVNILKDLCQSKNVSLIFIAHDLSMVEYIADKILIMHLGKIVEFGKTEEIYKNPLHPYTINLFKSIPKISNANDKFESSNFELTYLEEQHKNDVYVDFFELNKDHILYSTIEQFEKWTNKTPKISEFTKNPNYFKEVSKL